MEIKTTNNVSNGVKHNYFQYNCNAKIIYLRNNQMISMIFSKTNTLFAF